MKILFKRYAVPACAIICVLALASAWTGVRLSADAGTYRLSDIEGDPAYLDGIDINMRLEDAAHTQHITLKGSALSHSYVYISPLRTLTWFSYANSQAYVEHEDANVEMGTNTALESSAEDYEIWVTRMTRAADKVRVSAGIERHAIGPSPYPNLYIAQVVTGVTVSDESKPFVFNLESEKYIYKNQRSAQGEPLPDATSESPFSYTQNEVLKPEYLDENGPLYAEAEDGTVYFTPSLRPYHGGTSAIYRVDEWGGNGYSEEPKMVDGYPCFSDYYAIPRGRVTEVATFPVDGHRLRTVALDIADDRLCLLLFVDGTLTLRVYSLSGALEYETMLLPPQEVSRLFGVNGIDTGQELTTTLFCNKSDGSLMLCYYLQNAAYDPNRDQPDPSATLLCVRLGEQAELVSTITGHGAVMRGAFIGGHWVLAERESIADTNAYYNTLSTYYISVLDAAGATLYRGEVTTDAAEDMIQYYFTGDSGMYLNGRLTVNRMLYINDIMEG